MIFFKRFEQATTELLDQLWQHDYLTTPVRNTAIELISPPLQLRLWLERMLLSFGVIFVSAGILLFFAFNWADIAPMKKLFGILVLVAILAASNAYALHKNKKFIANLLLCSNALLVGVFMAVFGQIYQTGADSYTLFLTWAIMILPWVVMARFLPLWVLWLLVTNIALYTWWDLNLYPAPFAVRHVTLLMALLHLCLYAVMLFTVKKQHNWLDRKWVRILLSIGIFAPLTFYIMQAINIYKPQILDGGFAIAMLSLMLGYIYVRWVRKSIIEYSVVFFCVIMTLLFALTKTVDVYTPNSELEIFGFLLNAIVVVVLFYYAYNYYRNVASQFVPETDVSSIAGDE